MGLSRADPFFLTGIRRHFQIDGGDEGPAALTESAVVGSRRVGLSEMAAGEWPGGTAAGPSKLDQIRVAFLASDEHFINPVC